MAIYIEPRKISETATEAAYEFFPDAPGKCAGKHVIAKLGGEIKQLKSGVKDDKKFDVSRLQEKYFYILRKATTLTRLAGHHSYCSICFSDKFKESV
jgi:hypothetical protein